MRSPAISLSALFLLIFATCFSQQQDLSKNYIPLKSSGQLPAVFTQNTKDIITKDVEDLKKAGGSDLSLKSGFIVTNNYQIQKIVRSGNALINDEVTVYLNKVVDEILKDDPQLRSKISIYTLKSQVVNAYSFDKGYVFVNMGLIAQVESEAQLAYILCHEIAHYKKQHSINSYVNDAKIDRGNLNDRLIEKCQYSKEVESEADTEGLKLFVKTKYNVRQAVKAFDVLQYSYLPFELVEFNKSFFETPGYVIPNEFVLKELKPISDHSSDDDNKSTHPNTARRKQDIGEMVKFNENADRVNYILGKEQFEYIRDLSRMETCRLYLKTRDYGNALYAAYLLQKKYPANQFVVETIAKCLYAISLYDIGILEYDSESYLEYGIPSAMQIESHPQQLYYLINKMPAADWTIMSLNYVYRQHKKYPDNNIISMYSDSLFNLMNKVDWKISDFSRITKKTENKVVVRDTINDPVSKTDFIKSQQKVLSKPEDSIYYKNVFADLFETDPDFSLKFPAVAPYIADKYSSFDAELRQKTKNRIKLKLHKVLLLEPVYYSYNSSSRGPQLDYADSDAKQKKLFSILNESAQLRHLEIVPLDPQLLQSSEVDKINDFSTINDWLYEKLDTRANKSTVLNTNGINDVIAKYGTKYALKTGVITLEARKSKTYFITFVYDLEKNEIVYRRYEQLRRKDRSDLLHAKAYQIIYDLTK